MKNISWYTLFRSFYFASNARIEVLKLFAAGHSTFEQLRENFSWNFKEKLEIDALEEKGYDWAIKNMRAALYKKGYDFNNLVF